MKPILLAAILFFAAWARADSATDRKAIESLIALLNDHRVLPRSLFARDAANSSTELARLADLDRMLSSSSELLSELTAPKIEINSIRFITPDVALVEGANSQFGSMILKSELPILFVMKREGKNWRIASFRILADLSALGPRR